MRLTKRKTDCGFQDYRGKPFFGDILSFALTNDRLPTNEEIAHMPKQGESSAPYEAEKIEKKEKIMSDPTFTRGNMVIQRMAFRKDDGRIRKYNCGVNEITRGGEFTICGFLFRF